MNEYKAKGQTEECYGDLYDYATGDRIRPATREEADESEEAACHDGGAGVIRAEGRPCYII